MFNAISTDGFATPSGKSSLSTEGFVAPGAGAPAPTPPAEAVPVGVDHVAIALSRICAQFRSGDAVLAEVETSLDALDGLLDSALDFPLIG